MYWFPTNIHSFNKYLYLLSIYFLQGTVLEVTEDDKDTRQYSEFKV